MLVAVTVVVVLVRVVVVSVVVVVNVVEVDETGLPFSSHSMTLPPSAQKVMKGTHEIIFYSLLQPRSWNMSKPPEPCTLPPAHADGMNIASTLSPKIRVLASVALPSQGLPP